MPRGRRDAVTDGSGRAGGRSTGPTYRADHRLTIEKRDKKRPGPVRRPAPRALCLSYRPMDQSRRRTDRRDPLGHQLPEIHFLRRAFLRVAFLRVAFLRVAFLRAVLRAAFLRVAFLRVAFLRVAFLRAAFLRVARFFAMACFSNCLFDLGASELEVVCSRRTRAASATKPEWLYRYRWKKCKRFNILPKPGALFLPDSTAPGRSRAAPNRPFSSVAAPTGDPRRGTRRSRRRARSAPRMLPVRRPRGPADPGRPYRRKLTTGTWN